MKCRHKNRATKLTKLTKLTALHWKIRDFGAVPNFAQTLNLSKEIWD
jgi:hypothetical protein